MSVNDVLGGHVMITNYLQKRANEISKIGATDEGIFMKDKSKNEIAVITLNKGTPHCSLCKSDFCIHVIVSFSDPSDYLKLLANVKQ